MASYSASLRGRCGVSLPARCRGRRGISILDPCVPSDERTARLAIYSKGPLGSWKGIQVIEQDYDAFTVLEMALEGNSLVAHTADYDSVAHLYERGTEPDSWALKQVLHSSEALDLRYGEITLDKGRALISYPFADVGGRNSEGAVFYYELAKPLNTGHAGAWANLATLGQGQLIDVDAEQQLIFLAWFTYTDVNAADANEQRWLTAQGSFEGSTAEIDVYETLGGAFDDPHPPETTPVGTMTINFSDCSNAQLSYALAGGGVAGSIDITRLLAGGKALCEEFAGMR